jgi:RNA-directed DNA polymerase
VTAKIDQHLQAAPPAIVPPGSPGGPAQGLSTPPEATAEAAPPSPQAKAREERAARWKAIGEAGGIDKWVAAQLQAKGLADDGRDPSKMSDREKSQFKERKKAEAAERRTLKKQAWEAYQATHITHLGVGVHWHDATHPDKLDLENREERARALKLDGLANADDLAKALGIDLPTLRWLAFHRDVDTSSHYLRWTIPKRDGTARTITSPKRKLKAAQRWALRNVYEKLPVHGSAHGFLSARSIVTNARIHAGAETLVKVDIKDFFPTVTFRRVKGLLRKAGLPEGVATLLSLISTESPRDVVQFRGKTLYVAKGPRTLPQGAPTSPAITNAICLRLDRRMSGLSRALGLRYSRYADDMTFSWRSPEPAVQGTHPRAPVGALLRGLRTILRAEGFVLHPSKTKVMRDGGRQIVTGLIINGAPDRPAARVPRETLRTLRAALHNREKGKPGKEGETLAQLKGLAAFVHMTDPVRGRPLLDRVAALEAKASPAKLRVLPGFHTAWAGGRGLPSPAGRCAGVSRSHQPGPRSEHYFQGRSGVLVCGAGRGHVASYSRRKP